MESGWLLYLPCFIEIPVFNANSVHPDQTPRSAASDLGLHCLPMSLLLGVRHKWVKRLHAFKILFLVESIILSLDVYISLPNCPIKHSKKRNILSVHNFRQMFRILPYFNRFIFFQIFGYLLTIVLLHKCVEMSLTHLLLLFPKTDTAKQCISRSRRYRMRRLTRIYTVCITYMIICLKIMEDNINKTPLNLEKRSF